MYVPQLMLLKDGPVTMTTMKLNIQLEAVLNALAGARIRNPTISAGYVIVNSSKGLCSAGAGRTYSHVIPSHPTAKKELKTKRSTADTICVADVSMLPRIARRTIVRH